MTYRVSWVIDVDAPNPVEAARIARGLQLRHDITAGIFDVEPPASATAPFPPPVITVDLDEIDGIA